jgi:hypothetical protein
MKNKHAFIIAGFFILFLSGCIPSIHPLYSDEDIVFKTELLGSWAEGDAKWVFEQRGENGYLLKYYEKENFFRDTATFSDFEVTLLKLGNNYYLDFYPGENDQLDFSSLLIATLLPVHIFAKVDFVDEGVEISFFDRDWLEELLDENRIRIAHEKTSEYFVLTASTDELQKFVIKYSDVEDAFVEPSLLERIIE